jgi:hypothetical protein
MKPKIKQISISRDGQYHCSIVVLDEHGCIWFKDYSDSPWEKLEDLPETCDKCNKPV